MLFLAPASFGQDKFSAGLELFRKQQYKPALELFDSSAGGNDKESERLYYCALCRLHLGQNEKGKFILQEVRDKFPGSEAARLALNYLKDQEIAGKMSGQAAPQTEPEEVSIPFRRTSKGQITVTVDLEGRSLEMIFDTGAEECLFGSKQIESTNLKNAKRSQSALLHSVSGPVRVYQVLAEIKLGSLKRKLAVCVQDGPMDTGILGQPFLKGYTCSIDNQAGLIRLHKEGARNAISLDSFPVPFREDGDKMIVTVQVNGQPTEMCFDTGAFGVCISKKQCERLGLKFPDTIPDRRPGPNGQVISSWETTADIQLKSIIKRAFPVRVLESEMSYPLLGQNFFFDRSYSIDRKKKEIRFAR